MTSKSTFATAIFLAVSAATLCQPGLADTRCVPVHDGVEYRSYLPDGKRFVYAAVKLLPGVYPTVFVIVDKNYETPAVKLAANDPLNQWWIDRTRPFAFSAENVRIRWKENHTFDFVTNWFAESGPEELSQPIRGVEKRGDRFAGPGATDTNAFAFQIRLDMNGFTDDAFEVSVPSVTYEGVTVTPPIVLFERGESGFKAKC
ncbi:hypothetical protein [Rhizomicrobium electricum]|uniref:Uncharacterized protein n=1 Tax=Rhizomicrobium electricum TaxID=480070 RepID=A0ABP3P6S3_9PROT|nr:hypothetical protein [Rhizomicrobium electricum]NIJ47594.1 hypothetical protein [Rhizomicrobium electricum]